jgi:serine protease Do
VNVIPRRSLIVLALLAVPAAAMAQAPDGAHREVYRKAAPAVVAVRAMAPLGERSGSGFVIDPSGLVLTSYACCPEGSTDVRVWVRGPRMLPAEIVAGSRKDELTLLRVKPDAPLPALELGASAGLRVGQRSYTIGNAANSIILDDQPSLNVGIVSAVYRLNEERANSTYTGPAFETSAAVNVGMEGAPCLDAGGRVVGVVTLNYSPHRFLGVAVPVDELKPAIARLRAASAPAAAETAPAGEGSAGFTLREEGGRVVIAAVTRGGPADREGVGPGDVLLSVGERPVRSLADARALLGGLEAGAVVWLRLEIAGRAETVKLTLERAK